MKQKGFTLIEALVVMIVFAIIVAMGMPSYRHMMEQSRLKAVVEEWRNSFQYAQKEAMRLQKKVTLCPSRDGESCVDNNDFAGGWIIVVKNDNNVLSLYAPKNRNDSIKLTDQETTSGITFKNDGTLEGFNQGTLTATNEDGDVTLKLTINKNGRIREG